MRAKMVLAVALGAAALGQPGAAPLRFDVASVKPSAGDYGPTMRIDPGGRFTAIGITLRNLITLAYGIRDEDLSGAPGWINGARFDIVAKPQGAVANAVSREARKQQMLRLQVLLQERFQLTVHRKLEERHVLALVTAKTGPKLPATDRGACPDSADGPGSITSMQMFSLTLSNLLTQRVVDDTGLGGDFCVRIRWTTDEGVPRFIGVRGTRPDAPSIFTALQQQLGLRLEPRKMMVDTLVVDRVTEPASN